MSGGPPNPLHDPRDQRLTALEEHAAFAEHSTDQLSAEIAELNKRLHTLSTRIDVLEHRLAKLLQPPAPPADAESTDEP
jgi:uncharacterized coiled-coil protein SlyX